MTSDSLAAAQSQLEDVATEIIPWVDWLGRIGFAAIGFVYLAMGILAGRAALGAGGRATDYQGALFEILSQPFGQLLLAAVAVGLFCYALWRFVQAAVDPEKWGRDASGLTRRAGAVLSGLGYGALGFEAGRILLGLGGGESSDEQARDWTATLLMQPFGRWLVIGAGLGIIGYAFYQFYAAYAARFPVPLEEDEMGDTKARLARWSGRFGLAALGVVYLVVGGFLVNAARQFDPEEAVGIGHALQKMAQQPYGPWLLGTVALGVVAYGLFAFMLARYGRIFV
jgi:hypothetical protein